MDRDRIEENDKKGFIKNFNDFVLSILMIIGSLYLILGKITDHEVATGQGGFLARSDIWLKMIAVILLAVSLIMLLRSLFYRKNLPEDAGRLHFDLDGTQVATIVILVVYAVLLPIFGFFIMTFLATGMLTVIYTIRERGYHLRTVPKQEIGKILIRACIISGVLLIMFWFVFGKLLALQLPDFELFYMLSRQS